MLVIGYREDAVLLLRLGHTLTQVRVLDVL